MGLQKKMSPWDWFAFIEAESGRDLTWFWRAWYYETWLMDQAVGTVTPADDHTLITVLDNGDAPMPVHLLLTLENGEEVEFIHESVDAWLAGSRQLQLEVPYNGVVRVEIDANRHFPDAERSNNVWEK